jgi:capsular polysaccharide transport system permease protein
MIFLRGAAHRAASVSPMLITGSARLGGKEFMIGLVRRAQAIARTAGAVAGVRPGLPGTIGQTLGRLFGSLNIWFWAIVGVPTLMAGVYYFGVASNLYASEAQFVVRGPSKSPAGVLSSMFMGSVGSGVADDTQVVEAFILSRDMVEKLEKHEDLRAFLSRPEGDFLTRYPGLAFWRTDFEALYRTYENFVTVKVDSSSGIATLQVKAYRPDDAQRIERALLAYSEELINKLNDRARLDALKTFQEEVDTSEARLGHIQDELTAYRVKAHMLEPKAEATGPFTLLEQLNKESAGAKAQLADALKNAPRSPQVALLRTRISSLDKLIAEERTKITGGDDSVATAMNGYERLNLQSEMEQKLLAQAVASREQARLQAQRQQLYLETIAVPNLADYPLYPKRAFSFATVVGCCLLAYGITWLLVAGVREHASA